MFEPVYLKNDSCARYARHCKIIKQLISEGYYDAGWKPEAKGRYGQIEYLLENPSEPPATIEG